MYKVEIEIEAEGVTYEAVQHITSVVYKELNNCAMKDIDNTYFKVRYTKDDEYVDSDEGEIEI